MFDELGAGSSAAADYLKQTEQQLGDVRHGLLGGMAKSIETARRLVEQSQGHPTTAPAPSGSPNAIIGDPVTAPEPKPGPNSLQREHDDPDENDAELNRLRKFGKIAGRGAGELSKGAKELSEGANTAMKGFGKDGGSGIVETVGVAGHDSAVFEAPSTASTTDAIGSVVVNIAVAVTAFGAMKKEKR